MKQINVPDELYDFLHAMSVKMNTQDNAATADPIVIQICETKELPSPSYCADDVLLYDGENTYHIDAEGLSDLWSWFGEEPPEEIEKMIAEKRFDVDEVEELAQKLNEEITLVYSQNQEVYKNFFFTWDACREHIRQNQHHYTEKAHAYADHAWRNPEMSAVIKMLKLISKQE